MKGTLHKRTTWGGTSLRCRATGRDKRDARRVRVRFSAQCRNSETERHARHMCHPILLDIPQHLAKVKLRNNHEGQLWAAPCMHVRQRGRE